MHIVQLTLQDPDRSYSIPSTKSIKLSMHTNAYAMMLFILAIYSSAVNFYQPL